MTERRRCPLKEQSFAALKKGKWEEGIQFFIGKSRLQRLIQSPAAKPYDFLPSRIAKFLDYPNHAELPPKSPN